MFFLTTVGARIKTMPLTIFAFTDSGRFEKTLQYFPVRGYSFLPCDRDFSVIKIIKKTRLIIFYTSANRDKFKHYRKVYC